jgi:hypothetical protein
MKAIIRNILFLMLPLLMVGGLMSSCTEDEELVNDGKPMIRYVRVTNPDAADSLLVGAPLGNLVAVVGENLGNTVELWFNDKQAFLNPAFITDKTILVSVPNKAPLEVTNTMRLVFRDGSELLHDFETTIAAPEVVAMENEYAPVGSTTKITGDFFFEPISVTFTGGGEAEIVSVDQNEIEFIVPEGAESGPITVSSSFGSTEASFHYKDQRGLVLDYDELTAAGSWRPGNTASEDGIDGNYLVLGGPGETIGESERIEDPFTSQFWGHTRFPEPTNLVEGIVDDLVLKFEVRTENFYGSYLNIAWGPWDNAGNQEVWANLNGRGLWRPWEENDEPFSTDGEWVTVSVPINEMIYRHGSGGNGTFWEPDMKFDKNVSGTLSFWVIGTPKADGREVEIHIDNVRIVEK